MFRKLSKLPHRRSWSTPEICGEGKYEPKVAFPYCLDEFKPKTFSWGEVWIFSVITHWIHYLKELNACCDWCHTNKGLSALILGFFKHKCALLVTFPFLIDQDCLLSSNTCSIKSCMNLWHSTHCSPC